MSVTGKFCCPVESENQMVSKDNVANFNFQIRNKNGYIPMTDRPLRLI